MCTKQDHVGPRTIWSKRVENSNSICLEEFRGFGLVSAILAIIMWRTREQPLRNPSRVSVTQSSSWNEAGIRGMEGRGTGLRMPPWSSSLYSEHEVLAFILCIGKSKHLEGRAEV